MKLFALTLIAAVAAATELKAHAHDLLSEATFTAAANKSKAQGRDPLSEATSTQGRGPPTSSLNYGPADTDTDQDQGLGGRLSSRLPTYDELVWAFERLNGEV